MGKKTKKTGSDYWDNLKGWKQIETNEDFLLGCEEDGFMGLEELDPKTLGEEILLIDGNNLQEEEEPKSSKKQKDKSSTKKRKQTDTADDNNTDNDVAALKAQIEALKAENKALKKQKKQSDTKKKTSKNEVVVDGQETPQQQPVDVSAWQRDDFNLHPTILNALSRLGFSAPTHIQAECIPAAVRDRRDIIGAAQTGSGKTIAFGLPIMQVLLAEKEAAAASEENNENDNNKQNRSSSSKLRALILAPTRELALQVCTHLTAIGQPSGIWTVPIVGGISQQKQERLLSKNPQIVVATPGRLWDLMRDGHGHLTDLSELSFLVIDEADRMVQQGHYSELSSILNAIPKPKSASDDDSDDDEKNEDGGDDDDDNEKDNNTKSGHHQGVQIFVFSATLTLPTDLRKRLRKGGGGSSGSVTLESLMDLVPFRKLKPKIADLTSERKLADRVQECNIHCPESERDEYLYCILANHPGRTIVFVNAISSVRRLGAILKILGLNVVTLHAEMQQRQRLRALDRFTADENGVMVATDVAARGLDIKDIRCVVHYQLPASVDVYVHRSGRTARAEAEGVAIAIVTPKENARFNALLRALKREDDLPEFPIDMSIMPAARRRLELAVKLDILERTESKQRAEKSWRQQNAEALGIILSSDEEDGDGGSIKGKRVGKKARKEKTQQIEDAAVQIQKLKGELAELLAEPLQAAFSRKYFTGGAAAGMSLSNDHRQRGMDDDKDGNAIDPTTIKGGKKTKQKKVPKLDNLNASDTEDSDEEEDNNKVNVDVQEMGSKAASTAVAMVQRIKDIKTKANNTTGSNNNNKKTKNKKKEKVKGDPRAAALAAELRKRALKKQGGGNKKGHGMVVIPPAFGREKSGPSALEALRATLND